MVNVLLARVWSPPCLGPEREGAALGWEPEEQVQTGVPIPTLLRDHPEECPWGPPDPTQILAPSLPDKLPLGPFSPLQSGNGGTCFTQQL